jgi:hypothetical protein
MSGQKSAFDTPWFNSQEKSFFNHLNKNKIPRLVICGETEDFDEETILQFKHEGFDAAYVPMLNGGKEFIDRIHRTGDSFGVGEYYGIVGNAPVTTYFFMIYHVDWHEQHLATQPIPSWKHT